MEESENMQAMLEVAEKTTMAIQMVRLYERGYFIGPGGDHYDLSIDQINQLKSSFATLRTETKTLWDSVTG